MNNYITLDGKKYKTRAEQWQPIVGKPAQVRYNLDGTTDATFGPATPNEWVGQILGPVTPDGEDWGDIDDLRTSLAKTTALTMVDHYSVEYSVLSLDGFMAESRSVMWDAETNEFRVMCRLVRVYA